MAASSSATRIFPFGMELGLDLLALAVSATPVAGAVHRQEDAERGSAGRGVAFDDPAMVADDLRNQGKSEATSLGLGGDERVEQVGQEVERHAGAVVAHRHLDRQADALA